MIMNRIAALHSSAGEGQRALELHGRALAIAQKTQNVALQATTHASMGRLLLEQKDWKPAQTHLEEALRLFEQCGDKKGHAHTLLSLGKMNLTISRKVLESAVRIFREIGDTAGESAALDLMPEPGEAASDASKKRA